jgi:hypothetical protein
VALCFFARGLELPNPRRRVIREERDETRRLARSFRTIRARLALASPLARPGSCESDKFRRFTAAPQAWTIMIAAPKSRTWVSAGLSRSACCLHLPNYTIRTASHSLTRVRMPRDADSPTSRHLLHGR